MSFRGGRRSLLAQKEVHDPTSTDMLTRLTAVAKHVGVSASRIFEGVSQDREAVEGTVIVNSLGQDNRLGREPARAESNRAEGVGENITEGAGPVLQNKLVGIVEKR